MCLIGRAEPGSLRVVGAALRESQGIRAGTVVGMDLAEKFDPRRGGGCGKSRRRANPERSDLRQWTASERSRAAMSLDGALVSDAHLRALLAEGRSRCQLEGHDIIQSAPTTYVVDEARGVRHRPACSASESALRCTQWL